MSWSPGQGVDVSVALKVGHREPVDLTVSRAEHVALLRLGRDIAEITLEPIHVQGLRDQLPGVLAALGVLDAARKRAADAGSRTSELVSYLHDQADAADRAGNPARGGELRSTIILLTTTAKALDRCVVDVHEAASNLDEVCENARRLLAEQPAPDNPTDAA